MKTAQSRALMRGFLQSLFPALWLGVSPNSLHAANGAPPQVTARPGVAIVDDSATVVLDATPLMSWRTVTPKGRDNAIVGRTRVNARLTTTPWLGKTGKIYMVLPADTTGSARITWRGHGMLMDGQLMPGGRALVYSGLIREKRMEDVLDVQIEADGVRLRDTQQLRFHFEIDVE